MNFADTTRKNSMKVACYLLIGLVVTACAEPIVYPVEYVAPVSFLIGPEDVLIVNVWRNQDLSKEVAVRPDGSISMPLVGDVHAAGLTGEELAKKISDRLKEFVSTPTVSVQVKEVNSYFVFVTGEVMKPGKYPLKSYATVMQGISMAGGFTPFASRGQLRVLRYAANGKGENSQISIPLNYADLIKGQGTPGNFVLRSGDTIVVP
jgi:polysaccharide export outer membrane protein